MRISEDSNLIYSLSKSQLIYPKDKAAMLETITKFCCI